MIKIGIGIQNLRYPQISVSGGEASTWILANGFWSDSGLWDDSAVWID